MTQLTIRVTKDILEKAAMCSNKPRNKNCAIALAVRDIFPDCYVCTMGITFDNEERIELPKSALDFINVFDNSSFLDRISLPELTFAIEIPDDIINDINIDEIRPLLLNHPNLILET